MFNIFKQKPSGKKVTFKIDGMHCVSCSMNIDSELEDTEGVIKAETSYAQSRTVVTYDQSQVESKALKKVIESLEYKATEM